MRASPVAPPRVHFFVCANRRELGSPLGAGCGDAGDDLVRAMKRLAIARGLVASVWVTETRCLGVCPRAGATVAIYPRGALLSEVEASDAEALFDGECAR